MSGDDQRAWVASAIDALDGIRPDEVAAISVELRRSIIRPAQIVPEIAKLVSERRRRAAQPAPDPMLSRERRIMEEASERRGRATTRAEVEDAYAWERSERIAAGLPVGPRQAPLTRAELDALPDHLVSMGLKAGFLERRGGQLFERTASGGG